MPLVPNTSEKPVWLMVSSQRSQAPNFQSRQTDTRKTTSAYDVSENDSASWKGMGDPIPTTYVTKGFLFDGMGVLTPTTYVTKGVLFDGMGVLTSTT